MPDNLKRRQPEDPTKINMNQAWEVNYWCDKFGISETKLRLAVIIAGPMVKDVEKHLGKKS